MPETLEEVSGRLDMLQDSMAGFVAKINRSIGDPAATKEWYSEMAGMGGNIINALKETRAQIADLKERVNAVYSVRKQQVFPVDGSYTQIFPLSYVPMPNADGKYEISMYVNGLRYFNGNEFSLCRPDSGDAEKDNMKQFYCKWHNYESGAWKLKAGEYIVIEYNVKMEI